ncbi:MAG TPA: hypothetical protein VK186_13915 [Candidatus Deferrimicrobium sp.]|nr:hypothetical protein [Candidatus Deferrimicrobium sp.]
MGYGGRNIKVGLKSIEGTINLFYAFINGKRIISGTGLEPQQWSGEVPEGETRLKVRVTGIDDAKYTLTVELPGTANNKQFTFSLKGGYHEYEMQL